MSAKKPGKRDGYIPAEEYDDELRSSSETERLLLGQPDALSYWRTETSSAMGECHCSYFYFPLRTQLYSSGQLWRLSNHIPVKGHDSCTVSSMAELNNRVQS